MKEAKKKIWAPILVTVLLILYYVLYFALIIKIIGERWSLLLGIVPIVFGGIMIYVCIERVKEIKGGEEDDLSKY